MAEPFAVAVCPLCGWNRPIIRKGHKAAQQGKPLTKGTKPPFRFGSVDLDQKPTVKFLISVGHSRPAPAGQKAGFREVGVLLLDQVVRDDKLSWIADDILKQAKAIVERIEHARGKRQPNDR